MTNTGKPESGAASMVDEAGALGEQHNPHVHDPTVPRKI